MMQFEHGIGNLYNKNKKSLILETLKMGICYQSVGMGCIPFTNIESL